MAALDSDDLNAIKGLIEVTFDEKLDEKLGEKLSHLPTKDEFYTKMVGYLLQGNGTQCKKPIPLGIPELVSEIHPPRGFWLVQNVIIHVPTRVSKYLTQQLLERDGLSQLIFFNMLSKQRGHDLNTFFLFFISDLVPHLLPCSITRD